MVREKTWDAQMQSLVFNRADRMASAGGDFLIREFAQECDVGIQPQLPARIMRGNSELEATNPHRDKTTTDDPRSILIAHRAQQI